LLTNGEGVEVSFAAGTQDFKIGGRFTIDAFAPELQKAQDAVITVDRAQVSRPYNTFLDVIEGVTITVNKVDAESQTITVANSTSSLNQKITEFVNAYNELINVIDLTTSYDVETQAAHALFSDSGINALLSDIRGSTTGTIQGLNGSHLTEPNRHQRG
jgi:flagellar hook-associated protein 2